MWFVLGFGFDNVDDHDRNEMMTMMVLVLMMI